MKKYTILMVIFLLVLTSCYRQNPKINEEHRLPEDQRYFEILERNRIQEERRREQIIRANRDRRIAREFNDAASRVPPREVPDVTVSLDEPAPSFGPRPGFRPPPPPPGFRPPPAVDLTGRPRHTDVPPRFVAPPPPRGAAINPPPEFVPPPPPRGGPPPRFIPPAGSDGW